MWATLVTILGSVIVASIIRIILGLGIGFVTLTFAIPAFYSFISTKFTSLPPEILQIVGMLRVDIAITMVLSAAIARIAYKISAAPLVSLGS